MAFVDHCQTAEDVRNNNRRVIERRRAQYRKYVAQLHAPKIEAPEVKSVPEPESFFDVLVREAYPASYPIALATIRIRDVQHAICKAFQVGFTDLISPRRHQKITYARQIGYALCRELTAHSYPEIGRKFGNRDHTTVLHGCAKIKPLLDRVREQLPTEATVADWAYKAAQLCAEFPELAPFANCYFSKARVV